MQGDSVPYDSEQNFGECISKKSVVHLYRNVLMMQAPDNTGIIFVISLICRCLFVSYDIFINAL